ncbi:hypothetical protein CYMTET_54656 [Cymbomonas tetramitiformis]|uniref:Uncharacterized protein n=1 Tax=Cymbomonas tetramitiformis TaxID=36881 RepID=A0AAE0BGB4_9CHLO|nr:hypothetical protein CYMTET_54656 [Cymbomonas tetramitiformis]
MESKWTATLVVVACLLAFCAAEDGAECTLTHDFGLPFNVSLNPAPRLHEGKSLLAVVSWEGCATTKFTLRTEEVPREDSSYAVAWLQRADPEPCNTNKSPEDSEIDQKDTTTNTHQASLDKLLDEDFALIHSDILFAFPPNHQYESYRLKPDFSQLVAEEQGAYHTT